MWTIIKVDLKNLEFLKKELKKKIGNDVKIYSPKFLIQKYKKNKLIGKELNLLGDYLFCHHIKFESLHQNLMKILMNLAKKDYLSQFCFLSLNF